MNRPWSEEFRRQNLPNARRKKFFVEPIREWSFFRGDRVLLKVNFLVIVIIYLLEFR